MTNMIALAQGGFVILTAIFFYSFYREIRLALPKSSLSVEQQKKFTRNFLIVVFGWLAFMYGWSRFGTFSNFEIFPINAIPVIAIPLIIVLLFSFSKTVKELLVHIPQSSLIKIQSFRFYVEILLWALFTDKLLPIQMTFEGYNFDVVTGITAVMLTMQLGSFTLLNKFSRTAIIIWNVIGLGLLINIVVIAILSMPSPLRYFMNEPANTVVTQFPISLLPAFLVPLAYMLHILSIRKALIKPELK